VNSNPDLDGDGDDDVGFSATNANIGTVFDDLQTLLENSDHLFIFTTDHGGPENDPQVGTEVIINLWYETMRDDEFDANLDKIISTVPIMITMEQCYSGGFIDDVIPGPVGQERVIATAANAYESSYGDTFSTLWISAVAGHDKGGGSVDADTDNDKIDLLPCVDLDPIIDISLLEIQRPYNDICDTGRTQMFTKILIENKGNVDIKNAIIHLRIDSANTQIQLISDTIPSITAYTTFPYEFTKSYTVPNLDNTQQTYVIKGFIEHINDDTDILNDTIKKLACAIYNDVSIKNTTTKQWYVGQNIPNPSTNTTSIPYSIPQEGSIYFQLMSISGQILFEKTIQAHSGNNYLEINTLPISSGIYYYCITYQGERIMKKMTIQK